VEGYCLNTVVVDCYEGTAIDKIGMKEKKGDKKGKKQKQK